MANLSARVPTGIPGFDGLIEGGFERNAIVMLAADAGCGKSTFALQYLNNGAIDYGENGLYITFEEDKENIFKHMKKFGMDLEKLEVAGKLKILAYPPNEVEKFINESGVIADIIEEHEIKRVVIDSATSLILLQENEYKRRETFLKTMKLLRSWGCTTLLTSESKLNRSGDVKARFGVEYLADGFIAIHTVRKKDVRDIAIEVVKMRGVNHVKKMSPMKITDKGIVVYPNQPVFGD